MHQPFYAKRIIFSFIFSLASLEYLIAECIFCIVVKLGMQSGSCLVASWAFSRIQMDVKCGTLQSWNATNKEQHNILIFSTGQLDHTVFTNVSKVVSNWHPGRQLFWARQFGLFWARQFGLFRDQEISYLHLPLAPSTVCWNLFRLASAPTFLTDFSYVWKNWTPIITKKVDPSLTGEGINTHCSPTANTAHCVMGNKRWTKDIIQCFMLYYALHSKHFTLHTT